MSLTDKNIITATFDIQAVLSVPFAGDAHIYYKRMLSLTLQFSTQLRKVFATFGTSAMV